MKKVSSYLFPSLYLIFSNIGRPIAAKPLIDLSWSSCVGKIQLKVFGKGFGEEPFLRKVFPDKYVLNLSYCNAAALEMFKGILLI